MNQKTVLPKFAMPGQIPNLAKGLLFGSGSLVVVAVVVLGIVVVRTQGGPTAATALQANVRTAMALPAIPPPALAPPVGAPVSATATAPAAAAGTGGALLAAPPAPSADPPRADRVKDRSKKGHRHHASVRHGRGSKAGSPKGKASGAPAVSAPAAKSHKDDSIDDLLKTFSH